MEHEFNGFGTKAIHAGNVRDAQYGALSTPIYQSSTFVFDSCEQGGRRFAGAESGYIYSRLGNPTLSVLEAKIAALEGGEACVATASGMGAISSCLWTICGAGRHIVADNTLYGCTFALLNHGLTRYGVEVDFIDTSDLDELRRHLRPDTAAVYLETPANPTLKITDIAAVARLSHELAPGVKVVCDNTFASPALQNPLSLGADVVVHSATKYLNGHGDVVAGFVVGKADFIGQVRMFGLKDMTGAVLDPFAAFLLIRGLKTLELRMARHCENAARVAAYLAAHPAVERVYYPGLPGHRNHEVAERQMRDYGGMLSFEVKGGKAAGMKLVDSLKLITVAVSLGDAESLIEHPASMTHSTYNDEELAASGIAPGLIRLSAGLENAEDILADLEQALAKL
ncbi:MAG: methionine gamma-lyase [Oscillospiraceae bacterium]|nr:methionine gamma-lyase [Oscillospiraceae bacterium]